MIGISLEDLGIKSSARGRRSAALKIEEYPKAYDFSSELALYGSWTKVRDSTLEGLRALDADLDMWIPIFWSKVEGETEESIEGRLTGMTYGKAMHLDFRRCLTSACTEVRGEPEFFARLMAVKGQKRRFVREALALNEDAPAPVLRQLFREGSYRYAFQLLGNPALPADVVRAIYERNPKSKPNAALAFANAEVPVDILDSIVADILADPDETGLYCLDQIARRPGVAERTLISLFGICHYNEILRSSSCTPRVRDEFDRLRPSGGALLPRQRETAAKALKKVRSAIKTGRTGAIERRRGVDLDLLNAVRRNPDIDLFDVYEILGSDDF